MALTPPEVVKYVIVYDDQERPTLVKMAAINDTGISIAMVFVSFNTGVDLLVELMSQSTSSHKAGGVLLQLDSRTSWLALGDETFSWTIASFISVVILILCLGFALLSIQCGCFRDGLDDDGLSYNPTPPLPPQGSHLLTPSQVFDLPEVRYLQKSYHTAQTIPIDVHNDETASGYGSNSSVEPFKPRISISSCPQNISCSICLEEFTATEKLRQLPCNHLFHTSCILPWLTQQNPSCPLCKTHVASQTEAPSSSFLSLSSSTSNNFNNVLIAPFRLLFTCCCLPLQSFLSQRFAHLDHANMQNFPEEQSLLS